MGNLVLLLFQLALFQAHPQLKQFVRPAIERAVQELLPPVVDRSIKIALTTCEQIVKKVTTKINNPRCFAAPVLCASRLIQNIFKLTQYRRTPKPFSLFWGYKKVSYGNTQIYF